MIPVTHRGIANKVVFCTGMDRNENVPDVPVYSKEQTVVYLMALGRLTDLCNMMIEKGYPATLPVGICERATTPQQRDVYGTLETIGSIAKDQKIKAPAVVIVGEVVGALGKELESSSSSNLNVYGMLGRENSDAMEALLDKSI
jgi:siroheme synthase